MNVSFRSYIILSIVIAGLGLVSCSTNTASGPGSGSQLSSMPHNMPASWEGQMGMPGLGSQGGAGVDY